MFLQGKGRKQFAASKGFEEWISVSLLDQRSEFKYNEEAADGIGDGDNDTNEEDAYEC